jgi:hypothetical protein
MKKSYNDLIFSERGFRSWLHFSRFLWLKKILESYAVNYDSVIELGCYDGKTINYLPYPPKQYIGYDANWGASLDLFNALWKNEPHYQSYISNKITEFNPSDKKFDVAICMETLEHLPRKDIPVYLEKLAKSCNKYTIVTIPNEVGLLFLFKYLFKLALRFLANETVQEYSFLDIIYQTLGISEKVEQDDHKGFDYKIVIVELKKYFEVIKVEGTQLPFLPLFMNATIGILCKPTPELD